MKNFDTASKVNKIRRSKVNPEKLSKAISESNRNRPISDLTRKKLSLTTRLRNFKTSGNKIGIENTLREIEELKRQIINDSILTK